MFFLQKLRSILLLPLVPILSPLYALAVLCLAPMLLLCSGCSAWELYIRYFFWPWTNIRDFLYLPFWKAKHAGRFLYVNAQQQVMWQTRVAAQAPGTLRFVCLSDTHCKHRQIAVPDGDVLVHTGDILFQDRTQQGQIHKQWARRSSGMKTLVDFNRFLGTLTHRWKVVIGGNHDGVLEALGRRGAQALLSNATYLHNSSLTIPSPGGGKSISIYGCPYSRLFGSGNKAFQRDSAELRQIMSLLGTPARDDLSDTLEHERAPGDEADIKSKGCGGVEGCANGKATSDSAPTRQRASVRVDKRVDVLLTHVGVHCEIMASAVQRVRPLFHVFGHFHRHYGARQGGRALTLLAEAPGSVASPLSGSSPSAPSSALLPPSKRPPSLPYSLATTSINASSCDGGYSPTQLPIVFDVPFMN